MRSGFVFVHFPLCFSIKKWVFESIFNHFHEVSDNFQAETQGSVQVRLNAVALNAILGASAPSFAQQLLREMKRLQPSIVSDGLRELTSIHFIDVCVTY